MNTPAKKSPSSLLTLGRPPAPSQGRSPRGLNCFPPRALREGQWWGIWQGRLWVAILRFQPNPEIPGVRFYAKFFLFLQTWIFCFFVPPQPPCFSCSPCTTSCSFLQFPEPMLFRAPSIALGCGRRLRRDRALGRSPGFGSQETSVFVSPGKSQEEQIITKCFPLIETFDVLVCECV